MKTLFSLLLALAAAPLAAGCSPSKPPEPKKQAAKGQVAMTEGRENRMENREDRAGDQGNMQREQNLDQRQDRAEDR